MSVLLSKTKFTKLDHALKDHFSIAAIDFMATISHMSKYGGHTHNGNKYVSFTQEQFARHLRYARTYINKTYQSLASVGFVERIKVGMRNYNPIYAYRVVEEKVKEWIENAAYFSVKFRAKFSEANLEKVNDSAVLRGVAVSTLQTPKKAENCVNLGDLTTTSWTVSTNGKERSDMATGIPDDQTHHAENARPAQETSEPATYNDGSNALEAQQESLVVEEITMEAEKKDKESDINGSVNRVAQAIVITDRCVVDDKVFTGIKDVLVEHQNFVAAEPVEVPLSWKMESAIRIWNDHIGSIKPSARVLTTINDYMAAAMKGYFRSHSLDDLTEYCRRIARSPNLMGDKFNLIMGVCLSESFLKKVDQKIISMAIPLPSDRPPAASKMDLDGFTPQEMILRVYVASSLGIGIYNGWFKDLQFSEGKLKGYRDGFHQSRVEGTYIATVIRVEELHRIIIKHT